MRHDRLLMFLEGVSRSVFSGVYKRKPLDFVVKTLRLLEKGAMSIVLEDDHFPILQMIPQMLTRRDWAIGYPVLAAFLNLEPLAHNMVAPARTLAYEASIRSHQLERVKDAFPDKDAFDQHVSKLQKMNLRSAGGLYVPTAGGPYESGPPDLQEIPAIPQGSRRPQYDQPC